HGDQVELKLHFVFDPDRAQPDGWRLDFEVGLAQRELTACAQALSLSDECRFDHHRARNAVQRQLTDDPHAALISERLNAR
ncbi:hypothetical protein OFC46_27865, partial [Escherichia coli]|nr:hypothetical protein [Escherichia coli]